MIECSSCFNIVDDHKTQACPNCGETVCDDCVDTENGVCGCCSETVTGFEG